MAAPSSASPVDTFGFWDALSQIGSTWPDIFALSIGLATIVVTLLAVIMAFHLQRNYIQSVQELSEIRRRTDDLSLEMSKTIKFNASQLRESLLAVRVIFDLISLFERRDDCRHLLILLETKLEWHGKNVSSEQADIYRRRILETIDRISLDISARESELYWLVGADTEKDAHLSALELSKGDANTVKLIEAVKEYRKDFLPEEQGEDLAHAVGSIRARLRLIPK